MKNKFILSWIDESSLKILNQIKKTEELEDFLKNNSKEGLINIRSNFNKGTTIVANFPNEIIKFFRKISILNTKGSRKTMISLIKQFDTTFLDSFELDGKIYSKTKNVYPLELENIKKGSYETFSISNQIDPFILNINIENLYIRNVKFNKKIENIINEKIYSLGFIFCEFNEKFDFMDIFSGNSKEVIEAISFQTSNLPTLKKGFEGRFKKLRKFVFSNVQDFSKENFKSFLDLSDCFEYVKIHKMKFNNFNEFIEIILHNPSKFKFLSLEKVECKNFKKINLHDFPNTSTLSIIDCGYIQLKGIEKFRGKIKLSESLKSKYTNLKGFQKFQGEVKWI